MVFFVTFLQSRYLRAAAEQIILAAKTNAVFTD